MATTCMGLEKLVSMLDRAVQANDLPTITRKVQHSLSRIIESGEVRIPSEFCRPRADCYARRLLHSSPRYGYQAIAMIWGPGQGTALHDHAGIWCVEGVYSGKIEVIQYDLLESSDDRFHFQAQDAVEAHIGMAGSLIPPFEYHTIANCLPEETSITIHVYGGEMDHCNTFDPIGNGWFRRVEKKLRFHN